MSDEKQPEASLFDPLSVGRRKSRNRLFLAPMSVCYADSSGFVTDAQIEHYGRRALGGVGVVVTENFAVSPAGRQLPGQTNIWSDDHLPGLSRLAAEIKRHGALAIAQIVHAGRYAGPWGDYEAHPGLAPSAIPFPLQPGRIVTPIEISTKQIADAICAFANAARLAQLAGFDGVEIHGAQGFLISQFLSPRSNKRHDVWGGDPGRRSRFAREVLAAVRSAVTDDFIVGWHMLSDELMEGGYGLEDAKALACELQAGIDFLIPVAGTFEAFQQTENHGLMTRPAFQLESAIQIAQLLDIPVVANGNLGTAAHMAALIEKEGISAIGLARPLLSDPDWPRKVIEGREGEINRCNCQPPLCLQTQLSGVKCSAWPSAIQETGHYGYQDQ